MKHTRTQISATQPEAAACTDEHNIRTERPTNRRGMLRATLGVMAATAGAGALLDLSQGTAAAAALTATLTETATGAGNTAIEADGTNGANGLIGTGDSGDAIRGISQSGAGLYGQTATGNAVYATATGTGHGVQAYSTSGAAVAAQGASGIGLYASSQSGNGALILTGGAASIPGVNAAVQAGGGSGYLGVFAFGRTGVRAFGSAYGGDLSGRLAPLRLRPGTTSGPPTTDTHAVGEFFVDAAGALYFCTVSGTPGTWKLVSLS